MLMAMENVERQSVLIGHERGDHVAIQVLGRLHPHADDFWDGNWLMTPVNVEVGDFTGKIGATLRAEELREFRLGLQRMHASLSGSTELSSMEEWLSVTVAIEASGKVGVRGRVRDRVGGGNELRFSIDDLDQSDVPTIVESLQEVEASFPVLGQP